MKAKLWIDGKEFEVDVSEEQLQGLMETKKKTGYERVWKGKDYYMGIDNGETFCCSESFDGISCEKYENANYYSDITVAENNARADKLYRQLRRFAVEHREKEIDWNDAKIEKYHIYYNHYNNVLCIGRCLEHQRFGSTSFDTYETAQLAIDTFKDDLLWYFTEYKDSL